MLFGRYRLLDRAGSGATAHVWRALDERTGEEVALKRLLPVIFSSDAGRRRLVREFQALRGLDHPAIVRVRDLEVTRDEAALILDFVPGTSLRDRLAGRGRLSAEETTPIVSDLAGALAAAHAAGLVHRDVSPGNVLIGDDGRARLTDFGIARTSDEDATSLTQTGTLVGTLRYISPEQLRGEEATPRSDLFGLAAITYEMLAGQPPFPVTTPVALVEAQRNGPGPIDGLAPLVDAVVRRGLALHPEDRQGSVEAFAFELAEAVAPPRAGTRPAAAGLGLAAAGFGAVAAGAGAVLPSPGPAPRARPSAAGDEADVSADRRSAVAVASNGPATHAPPASGLRGGGTAHASPGRVAAAAALALGALVLVASAMGGGSPGEDGRPNGQVDATERPATPNSPGEAPANDRGQGGGDGASEDDKKQDEAEKKREEEEKKREEQEKEGRGGDDDDD